MRRVKKKFPFLEPLLIMWRFQEIPFLKKASFFVTVGQGGEEGGGGYPGRFSRRGDIVLYMVVFWGFLTGGGAVGRFG